MKQTKFKLFGGMLVAAFGFLALPSCSSEEMISDTPVFQDLVKDGLIVPLEDGIHKISVKSAGQWSATLPEDCNWAKVLDGEGNGNGEMAVVVDGNFTNMERVTTLTLNADGKVSKVQLRQKESEDGMAADNGADFLKLAKNKYLGFGCNALEYYDDPDNVSLKYKVNSTVNTMVITKLQEADDFGFYDGLANSSTLRIDEYESLKTDTIVNKRDSLGVKLSLEVAYGLFKFGISGKYSGAETFGEKALQIKMGANYPSFEASLGYNDIMTTFDNANDASTSGADVNESRMCRALLAVGFAKAREELRVLCNAASPDEAAINGKVQKLIDDYGTGFVSKSNLGAVAAMDLKVDSTYINETLAVDSARITADIQAGLFSLKADVQASYINASVQHLKHSQHKVQLIGGSKAMATNVVKTFEAADYESDLGQAIADWAKSVVVSDGSDNTAELVSVEVAPIWDLFSDQKSIAAIKKYLAGKYPNSRFLKLHGVL